jgi:TPR repeat protein
MRIAERDRHRNAIRRLKRELRLGSECASNNIAATYRHLRNFRRAFLWWQRTTAADGEAWLEVGYCLQYGIGTRRDRAAAIRAYRRTLRSYPVTAYGQEEAQYHLAVALLDRDGTRARRQAADLLTLASVDGDYPAAADLLEQLSAKEPLQICRCRRWLSRRLGGKTYCPWHRRPSVRRIEKA